VELQFSKRNGRRNANNEKDWVSSRGATATLRGMLLEGSDIVWIVRTVVHAEVCPRHNGALASDLEEHVTSDIRAFRNAARGSPRHSYESHPVGDAARFSVRGKSERVRVRPDTCREP